MIRTSAVAVTDWFQVATGKDRKFYFTKLFTNYNNDNRVKDAPQGGLRRQQ